MHARFARRAHVHTTNKRQPGDRMHYEIDGAYKHLTQRSGVSKNECAVSKGRDQFWVFGRDSKSEYREKEPAPELERVLNKKNTILRDEKWIQFGYVQRISTRRNRFSFFPVP